MNIVDSESLVIQDSVEVVLWCDDFRHFSGLKPYCQLDELGSSVCFFGWLISEIQQLPEQELLEDEGPIQHAKRVIDVPETAYCTICGEEQEIVKTVSWQADTCAICGNNIETLPA
ncbi:hypothetical protein SAMN04487948_10179 [Halogranum amylolyticum]|uniref:Uncharacterized protein n=1 Tax=Halogranum amylolyticum TaxID=660520 RepID=A0A1H8MTI5_9EURY|nr:hypothetical protein [Halogranum amylolyticum]SEO20609.1 hypothetical protein SAMN04487948_10179 [Halogranum amylolyticum]